MRQRVFLQPTKRRWLRRPKRERGERERERKPDEEDEEQEKERGEIEVEVYVLFGSFGYIYFIIIT